MLKILHEEGICIKWRGRVPSEKLAAIDGDIRQRKLFLYQIARAHGVGLRIVRERKLKILGPAPLKSCFPPLQSKFSQADAAAYVPTLEEIFLAVVHRCIDSVAGKFLRQGRDHDEVVAVRRFLKRNPSLIIETVDAGLRAAVAKVCTNMQSKFVN